MISPLDTWTGITTGLGDKLSPGSLARWQNEKLREAVSYARANTKFYNNKIGDFEKLEDLPFTYPSELAGDPLAFLAIPLSNVARVITLANSGTTSLKKRIFLSQSDLERTKDFFASGMSSMVKKGDHVAILISNKTENSLGSLLSESLRRIDVSSEIAGAIKSVEKAADSVRGADCIVGMPSELLYLARKFPGIRPKSVLLAADIAPLSVTGGIRENWKCEVFTHYGHTEFGYGCAVDCNRHQGLHFRNAELIPEIINPITNMPVQPGEKGEIVITTLSNEAMPLLRYRTGNISRIINTPCHCGSCLPRLGNPEGRYNNQVVLHSGETISIYNLDEVLFGDRQVAGFDAIYDYTGNMLQITIDSGGRIDIGRLLKILPEELKTDIIYDNADPFTERGKRKIKVIQDEVSF